MFFNYRVCADRTANPQPIDVSPVSQADPIRHTAFYRFVPVADPPACAAWLRGAAAGLSGSILVAAEGINGALAGPASAVDRFETLLRSHPDWQPLFGQLHFKHSACRTAPFARLKVHVRPEIVALGLPPPSVAPDTAQAVPLNPQAWREILQADDVVVLDNRNAFEYRLGHFAKALNPDVEHFRDFQAFVERHADAWREAGTRVAMYCTGGIRCEKSAPYLQALGLDVLQLDGGILNYFQVLADADRDWQGECFVFDNRIALDTHLQETATTAEDVYGDTPDDRWRLQRAQRLSAAAQAADDSA
ncbi:MAG: rhodanese-like domain-containing protein [Burkholderiaceae bacterium]